MTKFVAVMLVGMVVVVVLLVVLVTRVISEAVILFVLKCLDLAVMRVAWGCSSLLWWIVIMMW